MEAQHYISSAFGNEHPLVAKYNQNLVEAFNLKEESPERTFEITALCTKNVEIAKSHFGENSIYCVRVLYTLFTARLHEPTGEGSHAVLK